MKILIRIWGLQHAAEELQKVREPKIAKLKDGYSTNTTLIFSSWLKDIKMYVCLLNLSNGEAIQIMQGMLLNFYIDMSPTSQQHYYDLINHLKDTFQTSETFTSVVSNVYSHKQKGQKMEDNFGDEL